MTLLPVLAAFVLIQEPDVVGIYSAGTPQGLDVVMLAVLAGSPKDDLPPFVQIPTGSSTIVCLRSDPLVAPLLLRKELGDFFQSQSAGDLKAGLKLEKLPEQTKLILLDCFESVGFERAGLGGANVQVSLVEEFSLTSASGEAKKASSFHYGDKPSVLPLETITEEEKAKRNSLRNSLSQATPALARELRYRFSRVPSSRREMAERVEAIHHALTTYLDNLEKEANEKHQLGVQNLYKTLAASMPPLWEPPPSVSDLSPERRKKWMSAIGARTDEEWKQWSSSRIGKVELKLTFALSQADAGGEVTTVMFALPFGSVNPK